jgi:glyoxylase-like metal-dependent hydrolase (beta-lactamase superfamily II)
MPAARVYVHSIGAPHLVDPSKLLVSAERIYGANMKMLWGDILPVPEDHIVIISDGEELRVGSRTLRVLYTPGHAIHHVAFYDAAHSAVFAGDVAGVRLIGSAFVRPPTPPPDLNLEDWSASIERLAALQPEVLYLPHFGPADAVPAHFEQLRARLYDWGNLMLAGIRAGKSDEQLALDLARHSDPEVAREAGTNGDVDVKRYELATNYLMSAQGYVRYYRKNHPELLA